MSSVSLCREANTIFRGNSLATRCIDDMMKIVGRSYLTVTLKPVLNEVRHKGFKFFLFFLLTGHVYRCIEMCDLDFTVVTVVDTV